MSDRIYPNPALFDQWIKFRSACAPHSPIEEFDVRKLWDDHRRQHEAQAAQARAAAEANRAANREATKAQRDQAKLLRFEDRMRKLQEARARKREQRLAPRATSPKSKPAFRNRTLVRGPEVRLPRRAVAHASTGYANQHAGITLTYDLGAAKTRGEAAGEDLMPMNAQRAAAAAPAPLPRDLQDLYKL